MSNFLIIHISSHNDILLLMLKDASGAAAMLAETKLLSLKNLGTYVVNFVLQEHQQFLKT